MPRFILLYAALYAAFGVASPFLSAFFHSRGVGAEQLGLLLGTATVVRLVAAPLAGRLADRAHNLRAVLVACCAAAGAAALGYQPAHAFAAILVVALAHAATLSPTTMLADALSVGRGFEYGRVRGTGSAAFIAALLVSGQVVAAFGLDSIVMLQAALLGAAALAAMQVPQRVGPRKQRLHGFATLLRIPRYRMVVIVAALILGSHAMHDGFAMIRWNAAGIGPATASVLWSEAVAGEVIVFFLLGPMLIARLTPAGAIVLAALAGVLRWAVMAQTADVAALALVQPLHGITFALLHLSCMRIIAATVPAGLEGSAQALYGPLGIGGASALVTFASGALYARAGAHAFWAMSGLCLAALPLAWSLRERRLLPSTPEG